MTENEILALLRLQKIPHLGPVRGRKLVGLAGSPESLFENPDLIRQLNMKPKLGKALQDTRYLKVAEHELNYTQKAGISCVSFLDPQYPTTLLNCDDAPLILFTKGHINWRNKRIIAIVGTREMTDYGKRFCEELISDVFTLNPIIVSGFAFGVDICAQRAALDKGLQTVGCMAHGLDRIYPEFHSRWAAQIEANGGFVSEFWSQTIPEPHNFIRRNRIIAGLAHATIVIESALKGGSLATANFAFGYDREVFALPGRVNDHYSMGCNELIRSQKAQIFSSPDQFLESMNWQKPDSKENFKAISPPGHWSDLERKIAFLLSGSNPINLDVLSRELQTSVQQVSAALFNLELQGFVQPQPGKDFQWKGAPVLQDSNLEI